VAAFSDRAVCGQLHGDAIGGKGADRASAAPLKAETDFLNPHDRLFSSDFCGKFCGYNILLEEKAFRLLEGVILRKRHGFTKNAWFYIG
jgi:hypothetical protein